MTSNHSKAATLLIGKESVYGTEVAFTDDLGLLQTFSPTDKRTHTKIGAAGSREIQEIVAGIVDLDSEISVFLQHGRPLQYLLGDLTHTQSTNDWKHAITAVPNSISSFSMEYSFNGDTDYCFQYAGCKFNQGTIALEKDGILTFNGTIKAKTVDDSDVAAETAIISTLPILHYKHSSVSVGVAASEASAGKIQSFNLTFNNNPIMVDAAGSIFHQEQVEGLFEPTFDFTMIFENQVEHKRFLGTSSSTSPQTSPTPYSIIFNSHNGVALGSGRREFYAQLNDYQYEEAGHPLNVGEIVISSFKGNAKSYGTNGVYYVDNISSTNFD
jgi:hypothetical protein